jgi:hypothetical protein
MPRRPAALFATTLLALAAAAAPADEPKPQALALRVTVATDQRITADGKKPVLVRSGQVFDYRLTRKGDAVELKFDRYRANGTVEGAELFDTDLSSDRYYSKSSRQSIDVKRADANALQRLMFGTFDHPIAVIKLDGEGAEVERHLNIKGGTLINNNAVEVTRMFHPRFARSDPAWDVPVVLPRGTTQVARGTLHYAKRPDGPRDGLVVVDITGKLDATGKLGNDEIKQGTFEVTGHETYDLAAKEWVAGVLKFAVDLETTSPDGAAGHVRFPMTMMLTRREAPD